MMNLHTTKNPSAKLDNPITVLPEDQLEARLTQLKALMLSMSQNGFESFQGMDEVEQEGVLWLIADLVSESYTCWTRVNQNTYAPMAVSS